eukprot:TRINITY_DN2891_c0_g1_i1.p1 TRINITY_DN2891_c0_g1~~TRINITY_DN2891_c0_g1_i1.p1  ORF type:complete len:110 (-),score=0.17 TRINITY_DN2891_c0_g1_i1:462-791(-)
MYVMSCIIPYIPYLVHKYIHTHRLQRLLEDGVLRLLLLRLGDVRHVLREQNDAQGAVLLHVRVAPVAHDEVLTARQGHAVPARTVCIKREVRARTYQARSEGMWVLSAQ